MIACSKRDVSVADQFLQLIELWETFLIRLDAGEDGLPYYVPASETGEAPVSESTTSATEPAAVPEDEDEA